MLLECHYCAEASSQGNNYLFLRVVVNCFLKLHSDVSLVLERLSGSLYLLWLLFSVLTYQVFIHVSGIWDLTIFFQTSWV